MTEYITISSPDEFQFHKKLKNESARTGKPISLILREAFERYMVRTGDMRDFVEQEHAPLLDLSDLEGREERIARAMLRRASPERVYEIGKSLEVLGGVVREAGASEMPRSRFAGPRSPGVS